MSRSSDELEPVLAAVHVGRPREIDDGAGAWSSAICRTIVTGPVQLGFEGLAGDAVADTLHHGGTDQAICCHPTAHYSHWNDFYRLTGDNALRPGAVGENWTVDGAEERDLCIGDIYGVGSAVVQVSSPRVPCWKQERKLGLSDFLKNSVASMRSGFYMRVITPGTVQAGDRWKLLERPRPGTTVALVNVAIHGESTRQHLAELADTTELPEKWRARFAARATAD